MIDNTALQAKLSFTKETPRRERILNSATYLLPRSRTAHLRAWGLDSWEAMRQSLRAGRMPRNLPVHLKNLSGLSLHAAFAAYRRVIRKRTHFPWIAEGGWSDLPEKH